jgi:hypothetical protein
LIREIENYNPDTKITNLERNKSSNEKLQLNFNYNIKQPSDIGQEINSANNRRNSSFNRSSAGKIKHKNDSNSALKYNYSDNIPISNTNDLEERKSDALRKFETLKTSKDYLLINNNNLNEEVQFLKNKINKKKAKIRNFREKAFLLDQRLHNEEKVKKN